MGTWSSDLGVVLQDLGDLEGARVQLERALEISEAALGPDHPTLATFRSNVTSVLQALQDATPEGPASAV
jgi:eukaryotic-like serine/threonine-protein kinase